MAEDHRVKRVPQSIKKAICGDVEIPNVEDLVAHFFRAAGGAKRVGKLLFDEFNGAKPGSMIRQRILEMILRSTRFANAQSVGDITLISDDDLEKRAQAMILQMPGMTDQEQAPESDNARPESTGPGDATRATAEQESSSDAAAG